MLTTSKTLGARRIRIMGDPFTLSNSTDHYRPRERERSCSDLYDPGQTVAWHASTRSPSEAIAVQGVQASRYIIRVIFFIGARLNELTDEFPLKVVSITIDASMIEHVSKRRSAIKSITAIVVTLYTTMFVVFGEAGGVW